MQRVVSRGGDLSPETAVPPHPPPSSLHSAGLEASVFQSLPSARAGSFPGEAVGRPRRSPRLRAAALSLVPWDPGRGLPAASSPGAGSPQRRSPRSSRRPDGARGALHVQERRGALGAPRATAASGRAPRGAPRLTSRADSSAGSRGSRARTAALGDQLPAGCPLPTPSCRSRSARLLRARFL